MPIRLPLQEIKTRQTKGESSIQRRYRHGSYKWRSPEELRHTNGVVLKTVTNKWRS